LGSTAGAASTEDLANEVRQHLHRQEWNSSKDATSTGSGGDLTGSEVTRSLYVNNDQPRRSRPFEVEVGCCEFIDKFTTRLANSSKSTLFYATADEADAYVFYRFFCFFCFFLLFLRPPQKYQTTVLGKAERIFMKLLPNDSGENGVCIAVPIWGLGPK